MSKSTRTTRRDTEGALAALTVITSAVQEVFHKVIALKEQAASKILKERYLKDVWFCHRNIWLNAYLENGRLYITDIFGGEYYDYSDQLDTLLVGLSNGDVYKIASKYDEEYVRRCLEKGVKVKGWIMKTAPIVIFQEDMCHEEK